MSQNYEKLFTASPQPEVPAGLLNRIMVNINKKKLAAMRLRFVLFAVGFVCSLAAVIVSFKYVVSGFSESGFADFFDLLFSDSGSVMNYWQSYVYTLLETLPAVSIAAFLAAVFASLETVKFLVRDIKSVFTPAPAARTLHV